MRKDNDLELLDVNGNIKRWDSIRAEEFKTGVIDGLSEHNSALAISMLKDFENGINCTTKGNRSPASLIRIRRTWRVLSRLCKNSDIDKIDREKLSQLIIKENSEHFTRNVKVIYTWLKRTGKIKENPTDHISAKQFSNGKPSWVYIGEENMKVLLNALGFKYRALTTFLYDSSVRPEEAWKLRVCDFSDDFKILDIPEKRSNGERVIKKNSFPRRIKLKLSSELMRDYVRINKLGPNDPIFSMTQAGFNKGLRVVCVKLFGNQPTKARESPDHISAYDIRHNACCFWLKRYKTNKDLMYRFGWKSEDKIFYYSEFLDMRDTIDDEDLITKETKTEMEQKIEMLEKQVKINADMGQWILSLIEKNDTEKLSMIRETLKTSPISE